MNTHTVTQHIVNWLSAYQQKSNTNGFVVGVSGGIDSAVTSTLAAMTGSPTLCLEMPIHQAQSQDSRARKHIDALETRFHNVTSIRTDLTPVFDTFVTNLPAVNDETSRFLTLANSRARIRMTTLYYFAGLHGYLVAGTGNKVEDFGVGFYTKYGDGGVDLSPIADLLKTEVFELGAHLEVIEEILVAKPTDGLWGDDRSDEDQLGASYPELEWAMAFDEPDETGLTPRQSEVLEIYRRLNRANKHKMEPIPVCEIDEAVKFS
ncbi:MAG: NAD(+) synthase [Gammaproteobacteria bacterium]|nr:NAD(+) synthase [Gammaproteobacteria bacterium]